MYITDYSLLTPLGNLKETMKGIKKKEKNFSTIEDYSDFKIYKFGKVNADVSEYPDSQHARCSQLAMKAMESIDTKRLQKVYEPHEIAVIVGTGVGGMEETEAAHRRVLNGRRPAPNFIPKALASSIPYHVAQKYNFLGGNYTVGSACASGAHAIRTAYLELLRAASQIQAVVVIATESAICGIGVGGFASMRALAKGRDADSVPFSEDRSGFVMSEGCGVMVLESCPRDAKDEKGYIVDTQMNTDTAEITQGTSKAYQDVIDFTWYDNVDKPLIKAHATSTPMGDEVELEAIQKVYGKKARIFAPKEYLGHTLGASGVIEAVTALEYAKIMRYTNDHIVSNSFGFGGTNISLLLRRKK